MWLMALRSMVPFMYSVAYPDSDADAHTDVSIILHRVSIWPFNLSGGSFLSVR